MFSVVLKNIPLKPSPDSCITTSQINQISSNKTGLLVSMISTELGLVVILEVKSSPCCRVSVYTGAAMLCQIVDLGSLLSPDCSSKHVCILCVNSVWSCGGSAAQIQIIYSLPAMKHTLTHTQTRSWRDIATS